MTITTLGRLAGPAAIGVLAVGLAGCGNAAGDGGADPVNGRVAALSPYEVVLASYEDLDDGSYTMESTMLMNDILFVEATSVVADGNRSRASQDLYLSVFLDAAGAQLGGEQFGADAETSELYQSMFDDAHTEAILVDDILYLQLSGGMFEMMAGEYGSGTWFTIDLTAEGGDLGGIYEQVGSFDLSEQTERLLGELSDVEAVGDGVYKGTLDADSETMETMLGSLGGGTGDAAAMIDATEVTIILDEDGLLKSLELTMPEIEGMTMTFTSEVTEVGGDYSIEPPDADRLVPFEDLIGAYQ
jgi:hypothetical protein